MVRNDCVIIQFDDKRKGLCCAVVWVWWERGLVKCGSRGGGEGNWSTNPFVWRPRNSMQIGETMHIFTSEYAPTTITM